MFRAFRMVGHHNEYDRAFNTIIEALSWIFIWSSRNPVDNHGRIIDEKTGEILLEFIPLALIQTSADSTA